MDEKDLLIDLLVIQPASCVTGQSFLDKSSGPTHEFSEIDKICGAKGDDGNLLIELPLTDGAGAPWISALATPLDRALCRSYHHTQPAT